MEGTLLVRVGRKFKSNRLVASANTRHTFALAVTLLFAILTMLLRFGACPLGCASRAFYPTMNITSVRSIVLAGAVCALVISASAQVVELRATINQAQENPPTGAPGTGNAVMFYDVGTNKFDLVVTISGMTNTATASHIHEAAPGVNGGVVTNLGGESVYTRTGNRLQATFRDVAHGGDPRRLLRGEAYYNIHSAQFPGGEVRGQLIPQPKRLYAIIDVPQEQAAFPAVNLAGLNDTGGAVMIYDPMTNMMRLRLSLFNFNNPLDNSHFHAQIPGVRGPVVVNPGNNATPGG